MNGDGQPLMNRRDAVAELLAERGETLVVGGLGGTCWDIAACGDTPRNFYLWGAMGLAASTGLGLALARPEAGVLVITGDGEMLMGLGSLATIAQLGPPKLSIVVIDNERYGETGGQRTHTAGLTELAGIARAAGIASSRVVADLAAVREFAACMHSQDGPHFAVFKVAPDNGAMVLPPRDGSLLARRFRHAVRPDSESDPAGA